MKTTILTCVIFSLCFSYEISAQESLTTAGITASNISGSVSSTIGQTFNDTAISSAGSAAPGVQQAYEITESLGIDITEITLNVSIYPNPTTDYLNLTVGLSDYNKYRYELVDNSGKLLKAKSIGQSKTSIAMSSYPAAIYYLKVSKGGKAIKIFKVLKTDK
ncbi:T9SS type A sorting domain-containing protein [Epilithonimonas zeae]|uniref:T9SS type A sorting domain-containing protein n=1 Tax=Epilithonimonas zeae TaxID=1416779 RepID=UPI00200CD595|nr:T9SS type A sorting domain-containing protein [Epilithonimonas zeae]UQB69834.1 T9SS type A sorting domain-containing protein [Epilithonimonas zeae]